MKIVAVAIAAAALAVVPAGVGLVGNPSLSHELPVHVPPGASVLSGSDRDRAGELERTASTSTPSVAPPRATARPRPGVRTTAKARDDRSTEAETEPGDDRRREQPSPTTGSSRRGDSGRDDSGRDDSGRDDSGRDGSGRDDDTTSGSNDHDAGSGDDDGSGHH